MKKLKKLNELLSIKEGKIEEEENIEDVIPNDMENLKTQEKSRRK